MIDDIRGIEPRLAKLARGRRVLDKVVEMASYLFHNPRTRALFLICSIIALAVAGLLIVAVFDGVIPGAAIAAAAGIALAVTTYLGDRRRQRRGAGPSPEPERARAAHGARLAHAPANHGKSREAETHAG